MSDPTYSSLIPPHLLNPVRLLESSQHNAPEIAMSDITLVAAHGIAAESCIKLVIWLKLNQIEDCIP